MDIRLTQGMAINFGEPSLIRLHYLKVGVHVRMQNADEAEAIEHHMPALRAALVTVFSAQDEDSVSSPHGKEDIRQLALSQLQDVIEQEEGTPLIQDLFFTTFVIQR